MVGPQNEEDTNVTPWTDPSPSAGAPNPTHTAQYGPDKLQAHQQFRSKMRSRSVGSPSSIAHKGFAGAVGKGRAEGVPAGSRLGQQP